MPTIAQHVDVDDDQTRDLSDLTDRQLVEEAQAGSSDRRKQQAWAELVSRYRSDFITHARVRFGISEHRAEEMAQETFSQLYRHIHRYDPSNAFSTWAWTCLANRARNEVRNRERSRETDMSTLETAAANREDDSFDLLDRQQRDDVTTPDYTRTDGSSDLEPDEWSDLHELRRAVDQSIEQIDNDRQRKTLQLRRQGYTYEAIGEMTGVVPGSVKSAIHRAREKAKANLQEQFGICVGEILSG